MIVGAANMRVSQEKASNLQWIIDAIGEAKANRCDLLVCPEQILQGYILGSNARHEAAEFEYQYAQAEPVDGPSVARVAGALAETDMMVVFGMTERSNSLNGGLLFNTAVLVDQLGPVAAYRKVHQPLDELHFYVGGRRWPVVEHGAARIGTCICYDLLFPESTRCLVLSGANIIAFPTAWPTDLEFMYDALTRVRALENQVYLVAANQVGTPPGGDMNHGHSRIVSPGGQVLAERADEGLVFEEVDLLGGLTDARARAWYSLNLLKDREPSTYAPIVDESLYREPDVDRGALTRREVQTSGAGGDSGG